MRGEAYGDYAILQGTPDASGKVTMTSLDGGVFDESWQPVVEKETSASKL
jgi:hypothetical protein